MVALGVADGAVGATSRVLLGTAGTALGVVVPDRVVLAFGMVVAFGDVVVLWPLLPVAFGGFLWAFTPVAFGDVVCAVAGVELCDPIALGLCAAVGRAPAAAAPP
jgi:hypothetical protein